jgi:hypothetical protein
VRTVWGMATATTCVMLFLLWLFDINRQRLLCWLLVLCLGMEYFFASRARCSTITFFLKRLYVCPGGTRLVRRERLPKVCPSGTKNDVSNIGRVLLFTELLVVVLRIASM